MALIDTSELLLDPDFTVEVQLIQRGTVYDDISGENTISDLPHQNITCVIQGASAQTLKLMPQYTEGKRVYEMWYRGRLVALDGERIGDKVLYRGKAYKVQAILQDFMDYGVGYTHALLTEMDDN